MEDIIINGVSLNDLKAKKAAIQQGASQVIAENLKKGQEYLEQVLTAPEDDTEANYHHYNTLAGKALEHLEVVQLVAGISGVTFILPYYEEYGRYDSSDVGSMRMDDCEHLDLDWQAKDNLYKLYSTLESLESDACAWHSSRC